MRAFLIAAALAAASLGWSGAAAAQPVIVPVPAVVTPLPPGTAVRSVSLDRVVSRLNHGASWGVLQEGPSCAPQETLTWRGGQADLDKGDYAAIFGAELERAGFKVSGASDNLFDRSEAPSSEYAIAGAIKSLHGRFCAPLGLDGPTIVQGAVSMEMEWQIYSRGRQEVVAKVDTIGGGQITRKPNGMDILLDLAFAQNVKRLVASDAFRAAIIGAPASGPSASFAPKPKTATPLVLTGAGSKPVKISDAVGSVVLILTGTGHGSGFLVSRDGYLLTNQHVVGDAKYVKVRWSDGLETLGEVLRTDKGRDVALLKTDPRGRQPLGLRLTPAQPGETVFAIGAPLDARFQSTVTRGVASANRIFDGYAFLQSDVTVNPGNSGGPLLDESGKVIGVTDLGVREGDAPTGINLFIPARDALDFLGLKLN